MHFPIASLVAIFVAQQVSPDALLHRAAAEIERIQSYDVWYNIEVRNLMPQPNVSPTGSAASLVEERKKAAEYVRSVVFLDESDERAVRKRGAIHFTRKAADFLVTFQGLWLKEPNGVSTRDIVLGLKSGTAISYQSRPPIDRSGSKYIGPIEFSKGFLCDATSFNGFGHFGEVGKLGGLGPFPLGIRAKGIIHPEIVFDLLLETETMPRYFFPAVGKESRSENVVHAIKVRPGLAEGQIAIYSSVAEARPSELHQSRVMVFEPAKLPMPLRVEIWRGTLQRKVWEIEWTEFVGGGGEKVWFPKRVRHEGYWGLKGQNYGKLQSISTASVDMSRSRINNLVTDDDLTFVFPVDTVVNDEKAGQQYTVTAEGQNGEVHLDELYKKLYSPIPKKGWATFFGFGTAIVLLLVLLYCVHHRRTVRSRGNIKS